MITNHLIAQHHWMDISSEQLSSVTHPAVICSTIRVASDVIQALFQTLLPEEQQHALRFRQTDDHFRFVMGRALLRKLLGRYTKMGLENVPFGQNAYGKPELAGFANVPQFNVAHTGSFVVIGLDWHPVGIDMEHINPLFDFNSVLDATFSPEEIKYIENSSSPSERFYLLWTRKEAFLKHMGCGLSESPVHVPTLPGVHPLHHFSAHLERGHYHTYSCLLTEPDHILSICLGNGHDTPPTFYELRLT